MHDLAAKLKTFIAIADHKGIGPAASALGVANSSVSRQLGQLEAHFGTSLFLRTTRSIRLSEEGERLYGRAAGILADLEALTHEIGETRNELAGRLRVSLPWRYARMYVAPFLAEFSERYPEIVLELVSDDGFVDLMNEEFDAAVRLGKLGSSSLIARKVGDQRYVLAASPSYLKANLPIRTHDDLTGHKMLSFCYSNANLTWKLRKNGKTTRINIKSSSISSNNADLLTASAVGGAGIVIQPTWAIGDYLRRGELVPILPDYEVTSASFHSGIHVVFRREARNNPRVRAWIDFIVSKHELEGGQG